MISLRIAQLGLALVCIPILLIGYLAAAEGALRLLPHRRHTSVRPWLYTAPALTFLFVFLVYPTFSTLFLSFMDARGEAFVGFSNYVYVFTSRDMLTALRNNLLWLVLFTAGTVTLGLLLAVLTDRVRYESVAKAVIFLPMAISFVAASVIWKFMFDYRPPGTPQTGTLNALLTSLIPGTEPQAWLINPATNNVALIAATVWMFTGFCMVILSAGLKGIPKELLEAAKMDGGTPFQVLLRVTIPLLLPTLSVVATTMVITSLKVFDIVYVLTNGNYDTDVIATQMYRALFSTRHFGQASAIAVVLLIATLPIVALNIRTVQRQETV